MANAFQMGRLQKQIRELKADRKTTREQLEKLRREVDKGEFTTRGLLMLIDEILEINNDRHQ